MPADVRVTAEGDLERTPFAHLLVYAVDHQLTGAMFLVEPSGTEHIVRFVRGNPTKVRPGDGYARLGELMIEEGIISREILENALTVHGLLGDVLVLSGCIDSVSLDWLAQLQLVRRMVHLFELPPGTKYRYFDGHDALSDWGVEPPPLDPLLVLWAGLRDHGERSTRLQPTLDRLGALPLRLHPSFASGRFGLRGAELATITRVQESEPSLTALLESGVAPEPAVRKLIYALIITRFLDFGAGTLPVGVDEAVVSAIPSSAGQALGRLQLRATPHRLGAAAPDPAGDGERAPVALRTRRREQPAAQSSRAGAPATAVPTGLSAAHEPVDEGDRASIELIPAEGERESSVPPLSDGGSPSSERRVRGAPLEAEDRHDTAVGEVSSVIAISSADLDAARALVATSARGEPAAGAPAVAVEASEPDPRR
jgi:hypothetical protein